jgi:UDP-N-acetylmuramate dehydrogenase
LPIQENVPLAPMTTLGIGGAARYFLPARDEQEVAAGVHWAGEQGLPLFVLGGGSNIVVADEGFPGLVLRMELRGLNLVEEPDGIIALEAAAGEDWDQAVELAVSRNLAGIECLSGIPGTVGGTPVQNVGAYGQEVSETLVWVRALDRRSGCVVTLSNADCRFSYRQSIFNTAQPERYVVLAVTYRLRRNGEPALGYADLQKELAGTPTPSLAQVRDAVRRIRERKAMLLVPGDPDGHSAGSFFKNPVVSRAHFERIQGTAPGPVPHYPAGRDETQVKLAAAWLIENAGFRKGCTRGRVGISSKHTLALVNRGGASARELLALAREIQDGVNQKFGIELRPEPIFVGFSGV